MSRFIAGNRDSLNRLRSLEVNHTMNPALRSRFSELQNLLAAVHSESLKLISALLEVEARQSYLQSDRTSLLLATAQMAHTLRSLITTGSRFAADLLPATLDVCLACVNIHDSPQQHILYESCRRACNQCAEACQALWAEIEALRAREQDPAPQAVGLKPESQKPESQSSRN